ncbi:MAG: 30S ribosomal protein S13 [Nanoarchaeota archaeon]
MAEKEQLRYLVRVASTDLPGEKPIVHAMTKIKGVGEAYARAVLSVAKVDPQARAGLLDDAQVKKIEEVLLNPDKNDFPTWFLNHQKDYESGEDKHLLNADIDFTQDNDIKRLSKTKSYRGLRHAWRLPLRGQRTKSNFRRTKSKSAAAGKKGRKKTQ